MNYGLKWCFNQRRGLELIEPNDNLMNAYFLKAESALKAMVNERDNPEWEITASYYCIYFSVYAILMKLGIKCEIHSCTIDFFKKFIDLPKEYIQLLEKSKKLRNKIQYYVVKSKELEKCKNVVDKTLQFHLRCKKLGLQIDKDFINKIRDKIQKIQNH